MSTHFVYLFRHPVDPIFKIGFSKNPILRLGAFGGRSTALLRDSALVGFANKTDAARAEAVLHDYFVDYWVPQTADHGGYTEWFDVRVWPAVIAFVTQHSAQLRVTDPLRPFSDEDVSAQERAAASNRGGRRRNSGRKAEFEGTAKKVAVTLSQRVIDMLSVIGGGNLSLGTRIAAGIACPEVTAPRTPTEPPAAA